MPTNSIALKAPPKPSSTIHSIGYDPAKKILAVRLKKKGEPTDVVYHYTGVEQPFYDKFLAADSMGKFFASNIAKPGLLFTKHPAPTK